MMKTYLGDDADELDGFEFLTMAEAGELGHWEIVREMSRKIGAGEALELAEWAVPIQQRHIEIVRECSLELAAEEAVEPDAPRALLGDHRLDAEHDADGEQRERQHGERRVDRRAPLPRPPARVARARARRRSRTRTGR